MPFFPLAALVRLASISIIRSLPFLHMSCRWRPFLMIGLLTLLVLPGTARPGQPIVTCAGRAKAFPLSMAGPGAELLRWQWDFGDPGSGPLNHSTEASPVHTYQQAGRYEVRLMVERTSGRRDTFTMPVEVRPTPEPAFQVVGHCAGDSLEFWGENRDSLAQVSRWVWQFGEAAPQALSARTRYVYAQPGVYQVSLTLRTADGCAASATQSVEVAPRPPRPVVRGDTVCRGEVAQLYAEAAPGAQLQWSRPDLVQAGSGGYWVTAPLDYTTYFDLYQVRAGCRSLPARAEVWVPGPHNMHIHLQPTPIAALPEAEVQFAVRAPVPLRAWDWNLGDGHTARQPAATYQYAHPGTYDVSCRVTTQQGCEVLLRHPFVVRRPVSLHFPMGFSPNGDGFNDLFQADIKGVEDFRLRIYTTLGQLVYEADRTGFAWDGRVLGGPPAAEGVYIYAAEARTADGQVLQQEGSVTLVR